MNPEKYRTSMQKAAAVVAAFSSDLKAADQLAGSVSNNSIHEHTATSRNILASRSAGAVSINDILDTYGATRLLDDPEFRQRLQAVSDRLNSSIPLF